IVFALAGDSTITRFFAIYSRLTKHLPGSALTSSRISNESSAPVSSEIGSLLLSNNQSTCAGLSGVNNLNTELSAGESPSGTKDRRLTIGGSFLSLKGGGKSVAATCGGSSAAMSCHCCTSFAPAPLIK